MFDFLFGKKQPEAKITDFIWKLRPSKYNAMVVELSKRNKSIVAYYFEDTKKELMLIATQLNIPFEESLSSNARIIFIKADMLLKLTSIDMYSILFVEHHPSFVTESNITKHICEILGQSLIPFYTSLDEPIMRIFGSERIMVMMDKMGYKEHESISHSMVTESLRRSQQKIDDAARRTLDAPNAAEWLNQNVIGL